MPTPPADANPGPELHRGERWLLALLVALSLIAIGAIALLPADIRSTDIVYDDF